MAFQTSGASGNRGRAEIPGPTLGYLQGMDPTAAGRFTVQSVAHTLGNKGTRGDTNSLYVRKITEPQTPCKPPQVFHILIIPYTKCGDSFANLPTSPSGMLQPGPLRQKFPYQSAWVTPLFLSLCCTPNSTRQSGEVVTVSAPRGLPGPCLPGGTAGVRGDSLPGTPTGLAGVGVQGAPSPHSIRSPGPRACGLARTAFVSAQHLLCIDPEKLSPSPLAFMAPVLGALLPEPHCWLYMMQRLFPCIFPAPASLLSTLRGGDGCTASTTSAA